MGYPASLTEKGKTYDVAADLGNGQRLLIEVGGIGGALKKDSLKITQALQVLQQEAQAGDKVIVAINAHRDKPLAERANLEPVTPEALTLLTSLGVNILGTADLFKIWKISLTDTAAAREFIQALHTHTGGLIGVSP